MFNGTKYMTKRVQREIPQYLQNLIWYLIETMEVKERDILQVFKLYSIRVDRQSKQKIIHLQKQPKYEHVHIILAEQTVNANIVVITGELHSTMLLADEYLD